MINKDLKKIVRKIIFCALCFVVFFVGVSEFESFIIRKQLNFNDLSKSEIAVFGHSHAETAFNDSLISGFKSYARSGESYYYIYPKVKQIIKDNPQISTVFIEFSNDAVNASTDEWIWREKFLEHKYIGMEPLISSYDKRYLIKNNPKVFLKKYTFAFKNKSRLLVRNKTNYAYKNILGGYKYLVRDKTDSILKALSNKTRKPRKMIVSEVNLKYLDKIIAFLKQRNIQVYLVRSPIHPRSIQLLNEIEFLEIQQKRYADLPFLDFGQLSFETTEFGDLEHLNFRGARRYSNWVNTLIKEGLFASNDVDAFVANKKINFGKSALIVN